MPDERASVLVVDDDVAVGKVLVALLEQRGIESARAESAEAAIAMLQARPFDLVLTDVRMPGMDGMALLDHVRAELPDVPVVLITGHGSVALAVDAMKRGAADFVQKPFDRDEVGFVIHKALAATREAVPPARSTHGMIGQSAQMKGLFTMIAKVAASTTTVLVRGETGTGKELVARAIHDASPRKDQPFVVVHCAALPETLLESELFGYEKGAFTGATQRKPGRFELAHKGTLFLDEIGDVPKSMQVKLLRVLQERELSRVGGVETIRVDVRVVAATHRDLEAAIASGDFREDLFYRISVVPLVIPPLRERASDIPRLVRHFLADLATSMGRPALAMDDDAVALLALEKWPGNVRQLQNFVERVAVLSDGDCIRRADVEREIGRTTTPLSLDARRKGSEKEALLEALAQAGNNRTRAARILEVSRRTLYNKLREHGID